MTIPHEILVVDDERFMRQGMRTLLEGEGYVVETAKNCEEAIHKFSARRPNLVLLDVMMPKKNGLVTCTELRNLDAIVPIIFFTAADSEVSLVRGLSCGANDYISKSCSPNELLARISAAIARSEAALASAPNSGMRCVLEDVVIDFARMTIAQGQSLTPITRSEAIVMRALINNKDTYLSTEDIISLLYGPDYVGDDKVVTSLMRRLRRKLGRVGNLIVNRRGIGYKIV